MAKETKDLGTMLDLHPVRFSERQDLLATPVLRLLNRIEDPALIKDVAVVEIDPILKGGIAFCDAYGVPRENAGSCVVLEAKRGAMVRYVGALVPVGCRMDLGGRVRRLLGARRVSLAKQEFVLQNSGMQAGSITVVGLPTDWSILVDSRFVEKPYVFTGSGKVNSKLRLSGRLLSALSMTTLVEELGI